MSMRVLVVALAALMVAMAAALGSLAVSIHTAASERQEIEQFVCFSALVHAQELRDVKGGERISRRFDEYLRELSGKGCFSDQEVEE